VRSYCRHWQLQPNDADDIVQDVMSSVAKQIKDFDYDPSKGRFRAWLGTVAANKIKTFLIKTNKRAIAESPLKTDSTEVNENYTDPDSNWLEVFSNEILKQAMENIRPHFESVTWKTFQSSWIEDKPATEVAEFLSIPVHSVYVNKSRVLKRLEQEIRVLADDVAYDF
jgi:RNA polymerase sigma-70 factor (ECF subfamily)